MLMAHVVREKAARCSSSCSGPSERALCLAAPASSAGQVEKTAAPYFPKPAQAGMGTGASQRATVAGHDVLVKGVIGEG